MWTSKENSAKLIYDFRKFYQLSVGNFSSAFGALFFMLQASVSHVLTWFESTCLFVYK